MFVRLNHFMFKIHCMIRYFIVLVLALVSFNASAQKAVPVKKRIVEAACGECQFHMQGKNCQLAVLIDNKPTSLMEQVSMTTETPTARMDFVTQPERRRCRDKLSITGL